MVVYPTPYLAERRVVGQFSRKEKNEFLLIPYQLIYGLNSLLMPHITTDHLTTFLPPFLTIPYYYG